MIDTTSRTKIADIPLKAHPESFQLEGRGQRIFVNVPDAHQIAVVDRSANRQAGGWPTNGLRANFPMALDEDGARMLVVFRHPARLAVFNIAGGAPMSALDSCGDSDDVFYDSKRKRVYVSCGEGFVDVFVEHGTEYARGARIATSAGARTALFVPEVDRVFLAVRAAGSVPASIWVFRPSG